MTFEAWLRKQKDRDDAVGLLAKEYIEDVTQWYRCTKRTRIKFTEEYIGQQCLSQKYLTCSTRAALWVHTIATKEYERELAIKGYEYAKKEDARISQEILDRVQSQEKS